MSAPHEARAQRRTRSIAASRTGATAIEYALIAGFVSIAIVGGLTLLGVSLEDLYGGIAGAL